MTSLMQDGDSFFRRCFALIENKRDVSGEGGIERTAVLAVQHLSEVVMPGQNTLNDYIFLDQ